MKYVFKPEPTEEEKDEFAMIEFFKPYYKCDLHEQRIISLRVLENNQAHQETWEDKHNKYRREQ